MVKDGGEKRLLGAATQQAPRVGIAGRHLVRQRFLEARGLGARPPSSAPGAERLEQLVPEELPVILGDIPVGDGTRALFEAPFEGGAALGRGERAAPALGRPYHFAEGSRRVEDFPHRRRAEAQDERVRILAGRKARKAQGEARPQDRQGALGGAQRGALARGIAVEAEDGLGRKAPQLLDLRLGQRRAERRHSRREAGAVQRDDIHIAFGDDRRGRLLRGLARRRPAVKDAPLLEERRVRRIEVFGLPVAENAPAESDDAAAAVADREDDAVAEPVVAGAPVIRPPQQAAFDQERLRHAGERALQPVARVVGEAEAEAPDRRLVEAALAQIGERAGAARRPELLLEEAAGRRHRRLQIDLALRPRHFLRRGARHFEPRFGGELLDRLAEAEPAALHDEADDVAMRAAAEAMEEALVLDDVEGGRLLLVEGAEADEVAAALRQPDPTPDHLGERRARAQLVEEGGREGHDYANGKPSPASGRGQGEGTLRAICGFVSAPIPLTPTLSRKRERESEKIRPQPTPAAPSPPRPPSPCRSGPRAFRAAPPSRGPYPWRSWRRSRRWHRRPRPPSRRRRAASA